MSVVYQDCPFCLTNNLLKGEILAETPGGFLINAIGSKRNFLIIPKTHIEAPNELSDTWWYDFKHLLTKVNVSGSHYNLSLNVGRHAGQTIKHLHFWVIPRSAYRLSSNKGLASLITAVDGQG